MGAACGKMFKSKDKGSYSESESESKPKDHANNIMEEKSNSESCEVSSMTLLPEHLIIDILSRVPLQCLLNSVRYVCKPWATIIGSSHFANAHLAHSKPGLYVVENCHSSFFLDIKGDLSGHFERIDLETPPGIMSTCDGILLFWDYRHGFFVVNPILKCCLRLPPLPSSTARLRKGEIVIARAPRSVTFKVFFVDFLQVSSHVWAVLYVLKIGIDNSWKEIVRKQVYSALKYLDTLILNGGNVLYWITKTGVTKMDVDKEIIVGEYPLPHSVAGGVLIEHFFWMENYLSWIWNKGLSETLEIYILDIDLGKWTLYHEMGPFDFVAACGHEVDIVVKKRILLWMSGQFIFQLGFRQSDQKIRRSHFGYNIKTGQLRKIEGIPEGAFTIWLHTNSLASLPSTPT